MAMSTKSIRVFYVVFVGLLSSTSAGAEWLREAQSKMGTQVTVTFWNGDLSSAGVERGRELMRLSMAEFDRIENAMSTYIPDTEMWNINAYAADYPVKVSAELMQLLQRALQLSETTSGAFDITYDGVGHLYDYRNSARPDANMIDDHLGAVNYSHVQLDMAHSTVRFLRPGVRINLGGIAKGYSVERVIALLDEQGIAHASATAGGDTRILGDRRGVPWIIGIRHPDEPDGIVTRLPIIDEAVSTSGDYERFFIADGARYHHILDPASGLPTEGVRSVTVLGPDGTMTDGLSTSVFVLGVPAGLHQIESMPAYEAVIIDDQGQLHYSSGLSGY
jgi:FAD:protein FMN transferase